MLSVDLKFCLECNSSVGKLAVHIKRQHQMSTQEYYDKHIRQDSAPIICNIESCQNHVKFHKLSRGYGIYCSVECVGKSVMLNLHKDEDFKERNSKRLTNRNIKNSTNPEYLKKLSENAKHAHKYSNISRASIISKYRSKNIDTIYFYIAYFENSFKIGISQVKIRRIRLIKATKYDIFVGSIDDVTLLEEQIKHRFTSILETEWFDNINLCIVKEMIYDSNLKFHANQNNYNSKYKLLTTS